MKKRGHPLIVITALLVAVTELGATVGSLNGEPMELVPGWAPTRPGDIWAVLLTLTGTAALFAVSRFPTSALLVSSGSYLVFILRDYEFGLSLPAMVTIFVFTACGRHRLLVLAMALACPVATLVWIAQRTTTMTDEGTIILAWIAFGAVSAAFFLLPALIGEFVRLRRLICAEKSHPEP